MPNNADVDLAAIDSYLQWLPADVTNTILPSQNEQKDALRGQGGQEGPF